MNKFSGWFTSAASQRYPLDMDGESKMCSLEEIEVIIKERLLQSHSMQNLFREFDINPERLQQLKIQIVDLQDEYAETDENVMKLNPSLFSEGSFFRDYFFVVVHEMVHWLSRSREADAYFSDPEETLGFVSSIASELEQGISLDEIWNKIYPKVSWHFNDENDAREFFENMIMKAKQLLSG